MVHHVYDLLLSEFLLQCLEPFSVICGSMYLHIYTLLIGNGKNVEGSSVCSAVGLTGSVTCSAN
jgi:hypothetical protein